jgi:hypothetical protein
MALRLPRRPTSVVPLSSLSPQSTTPAPRTPCAATQSQFQTRNANLIRRPRRPYAFTQLVQLSDGSTYTMRTTSPLGVYRSTKDTRNHMLWNPSERSLRNVEVDEAGKLAAFRSRFGRGWDAPAGAAEEDVAAAATDAAKKDDVKEAAAQVKDENYDPLGDLISQYATPVKEEKEKRYGGGKGKKA